MKLCWKSKIYFFTCRKTFGTSSLYRDYFFDAAIAVLIVFILTTGRKVSSKSIQYYIIEQRLDFVCYKPFVRTSRKKRKEPDALRLTLHTYLFQIDRLPFL